MRRKLAVAGFCLALCMLLLTPNARAEDAPEGATVRFDFDKQTNQLSVNINSPVGIGGGDVKVEIPSSVRISTYQATGFMSGATYLSLGALHRWFQISANGQTQGFLTVTLTAPSDTPCFVTLVEVNLLDEAENIVPVETELPISVELGQPSPRPSGFAVLSPNGGEVLDGRRPFTIQWAAPPDIVRVDLFVSVDGGKRWREIARRQPNTGSFKWTTPNMDLNKCLIRIDGYDAAKRRLTDTSDAPFSVRRRPGAWFSCR